MARFYREFVDRIIVALILLMQVEKDSPKETILLHLKKHKATDEMEQDIVYRAISRYVDTHKTDEDFIANEEVLAAALGQLRKTKQHDTDLIETIVKALQLPHTSHYFHLGHLKQLRDAILRPDELAKWKKAVTNENLKCKCGHAFESGEAVSTRLEGDGTYSFSCHKCARPIRVACDRCGEAFGLSEKINYMGKVECGCHLKKKAEPQAAIDAAQAPAPPPMRNLRAPRRTAAAFQDEIGRLYTGAIGGTVTVAETPMNPFADFTQAATAAGMPEDDPNLGGF